jgi:hypothetical protein
VCVRAGGGGGIERQGLGDVGDDSGCGQDHILTEATRDVRLCCCCLAVFLAYTHVNTSGV